MKSKYTGKYSVYVMVSAQRKYATTHFSNFRSYRKSLLKTIQRAQHSIHSETFYARKN